MLNDADNMRSLSSNIPVSTVVFCTLSGRVISRSVFPNGKMNVSVTPNEQMLHGNGCYVMRIGFNNNEYLNKRVTVAGW